MRRVITAVLCAMILSIFLPGTGNKARAATIVPGTSPAAVIALAREQVGYIEKKNNSNLYDKTANQGGNNYTKFAYEIDKKHPDFYWGSKNGATGWCDIFVDWLFIEAYGFEKACALTGQGGSNRGGAAPTYSYKYYKSKGQAGSTPRIGAQIFYNEGGSCTHTGLVVDLDEKNIYAIDGNWGNKVSLRTISRSNTSYIYGFGYPGYEDESTVLLPVEGIELNRSEYSLNMVETVTLAVNVSPTGASKAVNWTSSDSAVATVNESGVVTPHGIGTTIITATSRSNPEISSQCRITTYYEQKGGTLRFNGIKYPHIYAMGKGMTWQGSVEADVDLASITITLYTFRGKYTQNINIPAGTKKYTMKSAGDSLFKNLSAGQFWLQITATDVMERKIGFSNACEAKNGISSHTMWDCNNSYMRPSLMASRERNGHKYELYKFTSKIWEVAKAFSEEKGGHLVTIADAGENDFVCNFVTSNDPKKEMDFVYTGGYYTSAGWKWVDGTPFSYHQWRGDAAADGSLQYTPVSSLCRASQKVWGKATNTEMSYFIVEYDPQPVTGITVNGDTEVTVDETIRVSASVFPANAYNRNIQWSSTDSSIATVDQTGVVAGKNEGDVVIRATATDGSGVSGQYSLHVRHKPIHVTGIQLEAAGYLYSNANTLVIRPGQSFTLSSRITPEEADEQGVSYQTSNTEIATVDDYSGEVTAIAEGSCELMAVSYDGGYSSMLTLIVINPQVMSHAEFLQAEDGEIVSVETYVQDRQARTNGTVNVYAQSVDGAYYIHNMACADGDMALLTAGKKIRVIGTKATDRERAEILNAQFEYVEAEPFIAEPADVTKLLYKDSIETYMSAKVSFKGLKAFPSYDMEADEECEFLYGEDGHGSHAANSDLYFNVEREGYVYTFIVESSLRNNSTEVYRMVENLQIDQALEGEGYLYWDYGPVVHVTRLQILPPIGSCGENARWEYADGTLTIRGSGAMADYGYNDWMDRPWECYKYDITNIIIENGITSIGQSAFAYIPLTRSVSIPQSVTQIGAKAFYLTPALTQVDLPENLTSIGDEAFLQGGIRQVILPRSVAAVGRNVWKETPVARFEVDENNPYFRSEEGVLFSRDGSRMICLPPQRVGNYTVPAGTREIGSYAFNGCEHIQGVTLPGTVTEIGEYAFASCERLQTVFIPESVNSIGTGIVAGDPFVKILGHAGSTAESYATDNGIAYQTVIAMEDMQDGLIELKTGESREVSVRIIPENSTIQTKYVEETDNEVCTVDAEGKITAKGNGNTAVTAFSAENPEKHATAHIWVHDDINFEYEAALERNGIIQLSFLNNAVHTDLISGWELNWEKDEGHDYNLVSATTTDGGAYGLQTRTGARKIALEANGNIIPADTGIVIRLAPKNPDEMWGKTEVFRFDIRLCYAGIACSRAGKVLAIQLTYPRKQNPMTDPDFVVPEKTVTIGMEAFYGIAAERIRLGEKVCEIGDSAFGNCSNLKEIYIPEGCDSIAATAFRGVMGLTIYGVEGSYAEWYASNYGYEFAPVE